VDNGPRRVLVVEDESAINELVATVLRYEGFTVERATGGREALEVIEHFRPDLVVLDVMLPDLDGFEVQRRIAASGSRLPVLFLTARDRVEDRVRGLTLGGDDYVTKPFSLEELVARVRAVLRRAYGPGSSRLVFEELKLDEELVQAFRDGQPIDLTPTEFKLLRFLMRHPHRVLSKAQILDHVWEYDFGGDSNIVETYISYLRRKLDGGRPSLIHTVRGMGYCLRPRTA
jgi:two-component system, OmpR family, response regulator